MKTTMRFFSYGLLIFSLVFTSCTKEGPMGQTGAQGVAGVDGMDGANGADGADGIDGIDAPNGSIDVVITDHNENSLEGASSSIQRDIDGITVQFKTTDLIPNNVYTLWFVCFAETTGPPTSTFAAGHIARESGSEIFSAFKSVDESYDNPLTGEVHLALRTHGPAQSGMVTEQIQTMDGGCTSGFPSGPNLYEDSETVGYCANVQVAKHPRVD